MKDRDPVSQLEMGFFIETKGGLNDEMVFASALFWQSCF